MKIKIIKKNTARVCSIAVVKEEVQNRQTARKMTAAVGDWVDEFQQRRRRETRQARNLYHSSFANSRQTPQSV